ncbi:serine hydrolase domain-containing protein [Thermomonospora amylolytica]|uniref:serine hydrolase domain-containing protein n=1 Tax=Thermomonospora amylolytica TaxID=1411117 RepID=UPI000E6BBC82|nr:serine hydrolase domain-containing protein [Thermomonospora amylolytica]
MRIRLFAAVAATGVSLAACSAGSSTTPAPTGTTSAPAPPAPTRVGGISVDLVRPSAQPVELAEAIRPLEVTYTYGGGRYTLRDYLTRSQANGFLVLDGRTIVAERYVRADRGTRFQSWSVAKSITSAAVGVALQEGRIRSIDDPVTRYLPELRGSGYAGVSVRDLLRMSSGIAWDERRDVPRTHLDAAGGRSLSRIAARQVRGWTPGTRFEYTSMNSFVLSMLIHRVTGMPYHAYVESRIWRPAGMESTVQIGNDAHGESLGYCCFFATARDYARFGLLYLNEGKAHGRQVVPRSWITLSTKPSAPFNQNYGLHWWLGDGGQGDFMAAGLGGQYVYVSPRHGVVIVKTTQRATGNGHHLQGESLAAFRAVAAEVARTR